MLTQTLQQINEMSQKIQVNVKKVLQETTSPHHFTRDTNYQTHPRSGKRNRKGHQKTSSDPRPMQLNTNQINKYMIEEQNEMLKQQIKELKQKGSRYRAQIKDLKKYVKFLEEYNDNLKKQVVLWMTRPSKKEGIQSQIDKKAQQYREKLNQLLRNRQVKNNYQSTKYNSININQSAITEQNNKYSSSFNLKKQSCQCKCWINQPEEQQPTSLSLKLPTPYMKFSAGSRNIQLQCTSCNYLQHQKQKNKLLSTKKNSSNYQKNSLFKKKLLKDQSKICKTTQKNKNHMKINSRLLKKNLNLQQPENISMELKTYRNDNLCSCHENYVRNRKF